MGITNMRLSWILLATIPSCLAFTLEEIEPNDELYVLKYPTKNELTCFSKDDESALVWNDDLSTMEPSDDFNNFEPVKPIKNILVDDQCAIWKSRKCFIRWHRDMHWYRETDWTRKIDWTIVSAVTHPMAPVYDFRWEGFKEYVVNDVKWKFVLSSDAIDGTIIFSIRGTKDVQIHLCRSTGVESTSCSVIKFAVDGVNSSIEYCEFLGTKCREQARDATPETAFLDGDEWRTFRLQWIKNERKIKVFRDTHEQVSLQSDLRELRFRRKIFISSSAVARIRFHDYNYILTTRQNSTIATLGFDWYDYSSCVNMLVSLCSECHLKVSLIDDTNENALANINIYRDEQFYSSGLREWQPFKLTLPTRGSSQGRVRLQFRAGLNNAYQGDVWWAMNELHLCEQNDGVRKSTIKLPSSDQTGVGTNIKCQKLLRGKTAVADLSTSLPLHDTTRLSKYVQNLAKSYPPGCRVSSTTNCDDIDGTSDRKNEAGNESGTRHDHNLWVGCFRAIPGKRNFTLDYSNSSQCTKVEGIFIVSVIVKGTYSELRRHTCSTIPCQYYIVSLQPSTTYSVVVESPSHGVIFNEDMKTLESAPGAIREVIFESITATSVKVKWRHPVHVNGIIRHYTITIQRIEFLGCWGYENPPPPGPEITKNVTDTTASFFGLHPYTTYKFKVIANTVEPGLPYSKSFDTGQLNIPTSKVSNLRIVSESILVWDPPANCTAITGFTNLTKLVFRGVSEWVNHFTFSIVTSYSKYDLTELNLVPQTKYEVSAYVVRSHFTQVNPSNCEEVQWTTAPGAPPTDKKSPSKQIETWLVGLILIPVICLLLLILFIWYRKLKKTKTQTIDSRGVPSDLRSSFPDNSRVRSSDAQDLPSDPVHTTSSENLERLTRCAQYIPSESPYMIPRDPSEQASHLQNVALAPIYTDIPNNSKEESSHAQNVPSDAEYWEILDNSGEQPTHPQDVGSDPLYMNTLDNSKGESSYSRDASLDPEYLIILDYPRGETSYAQDISLAPVYMNILNNSKEQTRHAHDTP